MDDIIGATIPAIACGRSSPSDDAERRYRAMREQGGFETEAGCGKTIVNHWLYAYRCLECARWMHGPCLQVHFGQHRSSSLVRAAEAIVESIPPEEWERLPSVGLVDVVARHVLELRAALARAERAGEG